MALGLARVWDMYSGARSLLDDGTIELTGHTFKAALLSDSHDPDTSAHATLSDIEADTVGTDQTLGTSSTMSGGLSKLSLDSSCYWTGPLTARYIAIYDDTEASKSLVTVVDIGGAQTIPTGATFTLNAGDIFTKDIGESSMPVPGTASLGMSGTVPTVDVGGSMPVPGTAGLAITGKAPTVDTGGATARFSDGFESGGLDHTEGGVSWITNEYSNSGAAMGVRENEESSTGTHALLFYYDGGTAECRFNLGANYDEVWVEWQFFFPADWEHGDGFGNNKFFAFWGGGAAGYSNDTNPLILLEFTGQNPATGNMNLRMLYRLEGTVSARDVSEGQYVDWMTTDDQGPALRGQWNRFRCHVDGGTTAADGVMQLWTNDTLLTDHSDLDFPVSENSGFDIGYFFGSFNDEGSDDSFYVDDVKIYTSDPGW